MSTQKTALITGATSGIGQAVAEYNREWDGHDHGDGHGHCNSHEYADNHSARCQGYSKPGGRHLNRKGGVQCQYLGQFIADFSQKEEG